MKISIQQTYFAVKNTYFSKNFILFHPSDNRVHIVSDLFKKRGLEYPASLNHQIHIISVQFSKAFSLIKFRPCRNLIIHHQQI